MSQNPFVVYESASWCIVHKPHNIPTAPLHENEAHTLVSWFLDQYSEGRLVSGRKPIEKGLIHRLDTATSGLVLFARTQKTFDIFLEAQIRGEIKKQYHAFCDSTIMFNQSKFDGLPFTVSGRFKASGPGRRKVKTIQRGMKGYEKAGVEYSTLITSFAENNSIYSVTCELVREIGRAHV